MQQMSGSALLAANTDKAFFQWLDEKNESFIKENGAIPPCFVAQAVDGSVAVVPLDITLMGIAAYKEAACAAFRKIAKENGIVRYAMVTEAWMATHSDDDAVNGLAPSERSDRREIVMAVGGSAGNQFCSCREIIRDESGAVTGLGPNTDNGVGRHKGRFVNLLDAD